MTATICHGILATLVCGVLVAAERRDPEPLVDVGAESASHAETEPLAVEFEHLSALRLCSDGRLLACDLEAEQIKVISPAGKQVGVQRFRRAGRQTAACSNMAIAATADGQRVYVIDYRANVIRVLQRKG